MGNLISCRLSLLILIDWQYAAIYLDHPNKPHTRQISLLRRHLLSSSNRTWQSMIFEDIEQTIDDGHNVVSLGICFEDGTLHFIWDMHDSQINYRKSKPGLAFTPDTFGWSPHDFEDIQHVLPDLDAELSGEVSKQALFILMSSL